jgi:hypothetical protein
MEDIIKVAFKRIGDESRDWIYLAQVRVKWTTFVENLGVSKTR